MMMAIFIFAAFALIGVSSAWGPFWLGMAVAVLFFIAEYLSAAWGSALAVFFGILVGIVNRMSWWTASIAFWIPISFAATFARLLRIESGLAKTALRASAMIAAWGAIAGAGLQGSDFLRALGPILAGFAFASLVLIASRALNHAKLFR